MQKSNFEWHTVKFSTEPATEWVQRGEFHYRVDLDTVTTVTEEGITYYAASAQEYNESDYGTYMSTKIAVEPMEAMVDYVAMMQDIDLPTESED